jgi:hypothetical protein
MYNESHVPLFIYFFTQQNTYFNLNENTIISMDVSGLEVSKIVACHPQDIYNSLLFFFSRTVAVAAAAFDVNKNKPWLRGRQG